MHRFFIPAVHFAPGNVIELPADVLRHLRTVLRLATGAECELFDGQGLVARAELLDDSTVRIISVAQADAPKFFLTLIQGMPKGEKLELVLQKGTELGANCFLPTQMERSVSRQMERSVSRLKSEREQKRLRRWEKIIQEAARQSNQPYLPRLQIKHDLAEAIGSVAADLKLLLWEESGQPLDQVLPEEAPERVAVIVGPEGGITPAEAEKAERAGYRPVSIGPRILRTETAGLAIMTILQYLYGDLTIDRSGSDAAIQGKDMS